MRIVIIGATGNVGTALLRRLHAAGDHQLIGVARRRPDESGDPYAGVGWHALDIGDTDAAARLVPILLGADAVVHLGWALQPNHDERAMRRTNVHGTAAVFEAAAVAGVGQVVVASSVAAYSFGPKRRRVDESWPTGGVPSSHYARYKAANERAMDAFEAAHPDIVVTRMRPGLIFQRAAATEVAGLFAGPWPTWLLSLLRLPVLPLPSQTITQAVHIDDVADALWRALDRRAGGAFNLAAEPVLTPQVIANAVGVGRTVPVRARVARALAEITWRLRLQATDPGWIDIAVSVPVMSTARAREVLGWAPAVSSTDALRELLDGIRDGATHAASGPLSGLGRRFDG